VADGYGYPGQKSQGGSSGGGYGYSTGSSAPASGGGKSRAEKRAEKRRLSPEYPKEQLVRLAARLAAMEAEPWKSGNQVDLGKVQRALAANLRGYSRAEIRRIGRDAGLDDVSIRTVTGISRDTSTPEVPAVLDYLGRPGQFVVSGVAGGAQKKNMFDPQSAIDGFMGRDRTTPLQAGFQVVGDSPGEAEDREHSLPSPVRFTGNLAGSVVTDPTTYITFGAGPGVKAGVRTAAGQIVASRLGSEVAEDVARQATRDLVTEMGKRGLKALTSDERSYLRNYSRGVGRRATGQSSALYRSVRRAPGGVRVAGHAVPGTVKADQLFKSVGRRAAERGVDNPGLVTMAERGLSPRAGARQLARAGEAPAGFDVDIENLMSRFQGRSRSGADIGMKRASAATKGLDEGALARVTHALENPDAAATLAGRERKAFEQLDRMRSEVDEMRVGEAGVLRTPEQLAESSIIDALPLERRFPRFLSDEAADLYRRGKLPAAPGRADEGGLAGQVLGRVDETKYEPTESLRLPSGGPRHELHPGKAMARDYALASRDAARVQFVDDLMKITDDAGNPFVKIPGRGDLDSPAWVETELPVRDATVDGMTRTQTVVVRKELAADFDRLTRVLSDDAVKDYWVKQLDKFNGLWKAYATSPLPFATGFVIRNAEGNLVNGFLLGNTNPVYLVKAFRLQRLMAKGVRESGDLFMHLRPDDAQLVREALDNGALETGFFSNLDDLGKIETTGSRAKKVAKGATPFGGREFFLLRGGRALNEGIENNARLGMFLGQRAKGLNAAESAGMVRKYLFDYTDLTRLDRGIKHVAPFWTWTRKNTPLQLATLLRTPGKITAQKHFLDALTSLGVEHQSEDVPQWMREAGGVTLPVKSGDTPLEWVPDLPLTSAQEALGPIPAFIDVARGKPGAVQKLARAMHNTRGAGGLYGALVDAPDQVASGRDIFSGRAFYPGERVATPSYLQPFVAAGVVPDTVPREMQYLLEAAMPGASKVRGALPTDEADKGKQTRRLISLITGQTIYPLDDAASRSESYRRLEELEALRRWLEAQGVKVPDTNEIRNRKR